MSGGGGGGGGEMRGEGPWCQREGWGTAVAGPDGW